VHSRRRRSLLLLAAAGSAVLAPRVLQAAGTASGSRRPPPLRVAYADSLPPISHLEQGRMRGAWVAVMDELARRLHLEIEHQGYPWARAQLMVRRGEADAMLTAVNPERLGYALAGRETVLENQTRIFAHKSNARLEELAAVREVADLQRFRIISYLGNGWLKSRLPEGGRISWLRTLDDAVTAVMAEDTAVLVEGERLLLPALRRRQLAEEFVAVGPPLEQTTTHLLVGRKSPHAARLAEFDRALAAMRREGLLQQILGAHGLD
jgi:polar amino acid transport system substrate-binding protein